MYSATYNYKLGSDWESVSDIISDNTGDKVLVQNVSGKSCIFDYNDSDLSGYLLETFGKEGSVVEFNIDDVPHVRSVVSSDIVFMYDNVLTQYFLKFDGVGSYGGLPYTVLSGDAELTFVGTFSPNGFHLLATKDETTWRLGFYSANRGLYFGTSPANTLSQEEYDLLTDGTRKELKIRRISGSMFVYIDGVEVGEPSATLFPMDMAWDSLGSKYSAPTGIFFYEGIIESANMKGAMLVNGQTYSELNYAITDKDSDIVEDTVNSDGAELWGTLPTIDAAWVDNGDGSFSKPEGVAGNLGYRYSSEIPAGRKKITFTITGLTGLYTRDYKIADYSAGTHTIIVDVPTDSLWFYASSNVDTTLSDVSVKETTDMLLNNVSHENDWYELVDGTYTNSEGDTL